MSKKVEVKFKHKGGIEMSASKKIFMAGLATLSVLFAAGISQAADNGQEEPAAKVRVCHMDQENATQGKVIIVSENAVKAHLGHGDPSIFVAYEDGSCTIVRARSSHLP